MAQRSRKTEHSGPKRGSGAYWGRKAEAKRESNRRRREGDKRAVADKLDKGVRLKGKRGGAMPNEFMAVLERDGKWFIAYCPEVPGANGQGKTKEEALQSLAEAIALILDDRREEGLRGVPPDAILEKVTVR